MFLDVDGMPLTDLDEIARRHGLAVPPAGRDVWICARRYGSDGLATLRREHVRVHRDGNVLLRYPARSGQQRQTVVHDQEVAQLVSTLERRRGGTDLLAWRDESRPRRWHDVTSAERAVLELLG